MSKDTIYRQDTIDEVETKLKKWSLLYRECCSGIGVSYSDVIEMLSDLPSAQSEIKPISYQDCANAMTMMWMDEVLTDGEYNRIIGKLNAHEMEKRNG